MNHISDQVPSIRRVIPKENYILEIHFQNEEVRAYDMKPLLDTDPEMAVLKDPLETTALRVLIETYPTHIAGLPICVNINCHATPG